MLRGDKQQIEGDLVLKERKVYVPKDKGLKVEIIQLYHDVLVAVHGGRQQIVKLVIRNQWWLRVTKDVGKYIDGYNMCQRMKNQTKALVGKLIINKVPKKL